MSFLLGAGTPESLPPHWRRGTLRITPHWAALHLGGPPILCPQIRHIRHPRVSSPKIPIATAADAIQKAGGVIAVAARALGIHRCTLYAWADEHAEIREAIDDARETTLDIAEANLAQFAAGRVPGQSTREQLDAIKYTLRTLGRSRGYGDRLEVEGRVATKEADSLDLDDFLPPLPDGPRSETQRRARA